MAADHLAFFLIFTVPLILVLCIDRKKLKTYLGLGILAIALDMVWDPVCIYLGLWHYMSEPKIFGMSVYMLLLYMHYMAFCYFAGNRLNSWVVKSR